MLRSLHSPRFRSARALGLLAVLSCVAPSVARADAAPFRPEEFQARRRKTLARLEEGSPHGAVLLLRAGERARYAGDVNYPYRVDSDLYYLTGLEHPGVTLVLSTAELAGGGHARLFVRQQPEWMQVWVGEGLTLSGAAATSGLAETAVKPERALAESLEQALGARRAERTLYFDTGGESAPGEPLEEGYRFLLAKLGSAAFQLAHRSPANVLAPLRQVKSPAEIAAIQKAIDATCAAHRAAMAHVRPGLREADLAARIEATFRYEGCSGWAFPSIVGSGPNSCILHYERYDRVLADGDLVLIDIGAEFSNYAADITRTLPVSGRFTPRQRQIYELVLRAQEAIFEEIRPGLRYRRINEIAAEVIGEGLRELGIIENRGELPRYLPHGVTHGLGLHVHDAMPQPVLAEGMVITVEPGVYIAAEELGVRIEDDVLVTADGCKVLSLAAPRTVEEVERALRTRRRF